MDEQARRELRLASAYGLSLGALVRIQGIRPEMLFGLMIVSDLCRGTGAKALITSVVDGLHMINSLHYAGSAVDFILSLVEDREDWVAELSRRLGRDFDVIDEGTHVHVEYQPRVGAFR